MLLSRPQLRAPADAARETGPDKAVVCLTGGGEISLSRDEAIALAKIGGFRGLLDERVSSDSRSKFGKALVSGWLLSSGLDVVTEVQIKATDFGLEHFESGGQYRFMDISTMNGMASIEVKTWSNMICGGEIIDQLVDYTYWRNAVPGRRVLLATVNWGIDGTELSPSLTGFMGANNIRCLRFTVDWL
jgi:hypothetical protein